jgi:type IV fimbrial biogenesis protein FimT
MTPFRVLFPARPAATRRPASAGGFTLIELMVTLAIAAIFASLAAPSLTTMIRNNRIQTEASSLVADLQLARTEAIKRGATVAVCPSSTGAACLTTDTWQSGWMIFVDLNGNGVYDPSTDTVPVLRVRKAFSSTDTLTPAPAPATHAISFNREGFATGMGTTTTMFKFHSANGDTKATRCVSVDLGGRLSTLNYGVASMTVTCS